MTQFTLNVTITSGTDPTEAKLRLTEALLQYCREGGHGIGDIIITDEVPRKRVDLPLDGLLEDYSEIEAVPLDPSDIFKPDLAGLNPPKNGSLY